LRTVEAARADLAAAVRSLAPPGEYSGESGHPVRSFRTPQCTVVGGRLAADGEGCGAMPLRVTSFVVIVGC